MVTGSPQRKPPPAPPGMDPDSYSEDPVVLQRRFTVRGQRELKEQGRSLQRAVPESIAARAREPYAVLVTGNTLAHLGMRDGDTVVLDGDLTRVPEPGALVLADDMQLGQTTIVPYDPDADQVVIGVVVGHVPRRENDDEGDRPHEHGDTVNDQPCQSR
jgi:hypothetical protein